MSMNFKEDLTEEHQKKIREMFDTVAVDERTALFNDKVIDQKRMKTIANETNQVVEVELHGEGDIKTMSDGTQYEVTPRGWKKISK